MGSEMRFWKARNRPAAAFVAGGNEAFLGFQKPRARKALNAKNKAAQGRFTGFYAVLPLGGEAKRRRPAGFSPTGGFLYPFGQERAGAFRPLAEQTTLGRLKSSALSPEFESLSVHCGKGRFMGVFRDF